MRTYSTKIIPIHRWVTLVALALVASSMGCDVELEEVVLPLHQRPTTSPNVHITAPLWDNQVYYQEPGVTLAARAIADIPVQRFYGEIRNPSWSVIASDEPSVQGDVYYQTGSTFELEYLSGQYGSYRALFTATTRTQSNQTLTGTAARPFQIQPRPGSLAEGPGGPEQHKTPPPCDDPDLCEPGGGGTPPPPPPNPYPGGPRPTDWQPHHGPFYVVYEPDGHLNRRDLRRAGRQQTTESLDQMSTFLSDVFDREIDLGNYAAPTGSNFLGGLDLLQDEVEPGADPDGYSTDQLIADMRTYYSTSINSFPGRTAPGGATAGDEGGDVLFRAYPNPTVSALTIEVPAEPGEQVSLAVYDLTGRRVYSDATEATGPTTLRWSLTDSRGGRTAAGVYVVRVSAGDRRFSTRVTVL